MKFNWEMPKTLRPFYRQELNAYQGCLRKEDLQKAWAHLERAHILGQPYPIEHTAVHFKMLQFGMQTRNMKEVLGQIPRLLVGGIKSWAGEIPVGNTGGANVPALKPMPIPNDLQAIIRQASPNS
ncbi:DUF3703 domain-containing protein [Rufibacter latericius]|uniref:DUF3703 domain-containing protein n=1 Tax=Rufibacter latericius TaxID=2487040 RepID=A0A3M9MF29_9BACT|nr:DUF3703 domain-containing protein [Rufibacter latericius]RNI24171.1 DUF3703 domain-containing protein [Rufibacter latericius]